MRCRTLGPNLKSVFQKPVIEAHLEETSLIQVDSYFILFRLLKF